MNYQRLKERQRAQRDKHSKSFDVRVHRSLSWLERAEQLGDDPDGQFIYLWIAFNAAYSQHIDERFQLSERETFRVFMQKLLEVDKAGIVRKIVYNEFPKNLRRLIDNEYIFQNFWDSQRRDPSSAAWEGEFGRAQRVAEMAFKSQDTAGVLSIVLSRNYTLRNQLMHGGATWGSSINRDQVRDCCAFMGKFVPVMISIMLDNLTVDWGPVIYPVVPAVSSV